jgi:hypothetical protein
LDLFWKQSKTGYYLTVRELVSAPLELASEFQSRLGARTMLRLEAVIRFCSEFFETKFKNLKKRENKKFHCSNEGKGKLT